MSIFRNLTVQCPACDTPVDFELVISVSADRRPDLRDAILDSSFQRETCPACGNAFRPAPEFTYMDIANRLYIGVWPAAKRSEWQSCAATTRTLFDNALGARSTPEAQRLGAGLELRVVFGWPALVEKIVARAAGVDDRTLEVVKLAAMRGADETPLPGASELRLVAATEAELVLAWLPARGAADDEPPALWRVPRQLVADIEAAPDVWQGLRASVAEGDVVDFQRELLAA